jgi:hypothetical protein
VRFSRQGLVGGDVLEGGTSFGKKRTRSYRLGMFKWVWVRCSARVGR